MNAPRRILILGASNVTLAFPLIATACLNSPADGPVELFAAHGHGRSFCKRSFVLNRGLPSLLDCGVWEALSERPPAAQSWALLTDVGNDLIYGLPVDHVAAQVETAIQRIRELGFPLTYVPPPLERILQLTEWQYRLIKQMLFPGPTVPWERISRDVVELHEIVTRLVHEANGNQIPPRRDWYGVDPIHIRSRQRLPAWTTIFSAWPFSNPPDIHWPGWTAAKNIWQQAPLERSYGKRSYSAQQPSLTVPERGTVWLY